MTRWLVTGGSGFIGSNFVRLVLETRPPDRVTNLDALTYAGNPANLADLAGDPRYRFVHGSIAAPADVEAAFEGGADVLVNFAAESHVDRSILGPGVFVATNVQGTQVLLEAARQHGLGRFVQVGTDEVYGSIPPPGLFAETSPLDPSSPYSASKAAADLLVLAYHRTFGLPGTVTRCSNNYGPWQFPEKVIPLFVTHLLDGQPVPLYGEGKNVRDWIHVADHCRALVAVAEGGRPGEVYNIGARNELDNLELTRRILAAMGQGEAMIRRVADRPGHDLRYAIDASKLARELGWAPRVPFAQGLAETIEWYRANRPWWEAVKSGAYRDYYRRQYEGR